MHKSELSMSLAEELNLPEKEAYKIVNTIIGEMSEALAQGEGIELRDFGSFTIRQYGSYSGRNPKTGEKIQVKPKNYHFLNRENVSDKPSIKINRKILQVDDLI